jgi:hypothetical protein
MSDPLVDCVPTIHAPAISAKFDSGEEKGGLASFGGWGGGVL